MNMASLATQQTSTSIRMTVSVVVVSAYLVYLSYVPETFCKGNYDGSCKRMMFLIPESFTRTSLIKGGTKT